MDGITLQYVPKGYGVFSEQLRSLPNPIQEAMVKAVNTRLILNPTSPKNPTRSEMLKPPLDCIRRIHVGDDYVIAYTVCDECKRINCDIKLGCYRCHDEPWWRVKLLACGPWDYFYKDLERSWRVWINRF